MCYRGIKTVHRENVDIDTEMGEGVGPRGPRGGFAAVLAKDNVEQRRGPGSVKDILEGKSTRSIKAESHLIPKV